LRAIAIAVSSLSPVSIQILMLASRSVSSVARTCAVRGVLGSSERQQAGAHP
jgi:hypothetical protein